MSAPIKTSDTPKDRLTKLLPADITAAFLSCTSAIGAFFSTDAESAGPIFWTFIAILIISPLYFRYVSGITNWFHIGFLIATFTVFAISIARVELTAYLSALNLGGSSESAIDVIAIVLPILWTYLGTQIFLAVLGQRVES